MAALECTYPGCGLRTRMKYPGNDPENGPARAYCPDGHADCYRCGERFQAVEAGVEHDACDRCEFHACAVCGEDTHTPECALSDRLGSALCFVCESTGGPRCQEDYDVCRCDKCTTVRVEIARKLRVGEYTREGLRHGAYPELYEPWEQSFGYPLQLIKFTDTRTVPGERVRHGVGAPGIGYREYYAVTDDGVGLLIEDTVRDMQPWEAR